VDDDSGVGDPLAVTKQSYQIVAGLRKRNSMQGQGHFDDGVAVWKHQRVRVADVNKLLGRREANVHVEGNLSQALMQSREYDELPRNVTITGRSNAIEEPDRAAGVEVLPSSSSPSVAGLGWVCDQGPAPDWRPEATMAFPNSSEPEGDGRRGLYRSTDSTDLAAQCSRVYFVGLGFIRIPNDHFIPESPPGPYCVRTRERDPVFLPWDRRSQSVSENFFDEQTEQSLIKATLVAKYFPAYMRVMGAAQRQYGGDRIAYIDLFAGPGRYKDGASSTPVKIVEEAIADPDMRQRFVAIFNDKDEANVRSLEAALAALPGYDTLKHKPLIYHGEVGDGVVKKFEETKLVPTLSFIDPWGYKGMTLRLINSVLKDWGCDCCFFFNYSRVNMGLANDAVEGHMDALFGKPRADALRARFADQSLGPDVREAFIVEEMCQALKEMGGRFVLPFRFYSRQGTRATHHLFFVSKHFRGYSIMKDLMHKHCTGKHEGVVNFEYSPADHRQPTLFGLLTRLDDLEGLLLGAFRGQTLTVQQIFERHSVGRPFVLKDYKDALGRMYQAGAIQGNRAGGKPIKRNTFPDDIVVTFEPAGAAVAT